MPPNLTRQKRATEGHIRVIILNNFADSMQCPCIHIHLMRIDVVQGLWTSRITIWRSEVDCNCEVHLHPVHSHQCVTKLTETYYKKSKSHSNCNIISIFFPKPGSKPENAYESPIKNTEERLSNNTLKLNNRHQTSVHVYLILWRPLLSYEYSYKASCVRPG